MGNSHSANASVQSEEQGFPFLSRHHREIAPEHSLAGVRNLEPNQRLTLRVAVGEKILKHSSKGIFIGAECIVGDEYGCANLYLKPSQVDLLEPQVSMLLSNAKSVENRGLV